MSKIPQHFALDIKPAAMPAAMLQAGSARFTILTDRLIRLEYHPEKTFEDRASQTFWFREQPVPHFSVVETDTVLEIETDCLRLVYQKIGDESFTPENLSITLKTTGKVWHPGDADDENLLGTTRTLDFVNGYAPLTSGLMSRAGWSLIDDSATLVFNDDWWLESRPAGTLDWYFFGYGHDYKTCLRDYCRVSGQMPLIPRWILGNWWSRYWAYSQQDLMQLINDFKAYELPFSVCIIDMDWHLTETNNTSTGWTGYTWNRELFPDPAGIVDFLHQNGLRTGLNLHPAEGIHPHEEQYPEMAQRMGIDPSSKEPIEFEITNPQFAKAYFEVLHHPQEEIGVDFWWVDWQQGMTSKLAGLDPLWLINHLHFYDLGRNGSRRSFIFSRWGNQGHQRYPIGFSGDSYRTWASLKFETYMNSTAANIAYGWWSHDIGGHTSGVEDSELFTRWVQFGVLSPIMRIHTGKGAFYDVRPWAFEDAEVLQVLRDALQLRHALIPYLYTMARRAQLESLPLIQPMYYDYPENEEAYHCPHQYWFGTELIAAPYVSPHDPETGLSRQVVWLPEGDWYDFFSGEHFTGNRWSALYGKLRNIPLFAKAGAIVPLAPMAGQNGVNNPNELHVHVFAGANNTFTLYEDDGETKDADHCSTKFTQKWSGDRLEFAIEALSGNTGYIPERRTFHLAIYGVQASAQLSLEIDGRSFPVVIDRTQAEVLHIGGIQLGIKSSLRLTVVAEGDRLLEHHSRKRETILHMLRFFKLHTGIRNRIAEEIDDILADPALLAPYLITMSEAQARALFETFFEAGIHQITDTKTPTTIILWNNDADNQITYRYSHAYLHFGFLQDSHYENGVLPTFKAITPPLHSWRHGAYEEHVQRTQWYTQIDYRNLLTISEGHRENTP